MLHARPVFWCIYWATATVLGQPFRLGDVWRRGQKSCGGFSLAKAANKCIRLLQRVGTVASPSSACPLPSFYSPTRRPPPPLRLLLLPFLFIYALRGKKFSLERAKNRFRSRMIGPNFFFPSGVCIACLLRCVPLSASHRLANGRVGRTRASSNSVVCAASAFLPVKRRLLAGRTLKALFCSVGCFTHADGRVIARRVVSRFGARVARLSTVVLRA